MADINITRRKFLQSTAVAAAASGLMMNGVMPGFAAPGGFPVSITPQRKSLVFIMLDGGNDSYNMLVPNAGAAYNQYKETRSNNALAQGDLLSLDGYTDSDGRTFGVHPSMPEVQSLFNANKLAFITNVGPLIEPVLKSQFYDNSVRLPLGLLSHADQFKHWQTSRPDARQTEGWFGYFADSLQPSRSDHQIPMNISLAGNNIAQNGKDSTPYAITAKGSVGLTVKEPTNDPGLAELNQAILNGFDGVLNSTWDGDPFKETYLALTREAQTQHGVFQDATKNVPVPTPFSDTPLSQQLKKVAQTIKVSQQLGLQQQTYFLRYIGWDHHNELLNTHAGMLQILSKALGEFQKALDEMGIADQVVTFTGSDFGRTLTSNGNGTDHGWGATPLSWAIRLMAASSTATSQVLVLAPITPRMSATAYSSRQHQQTSFMLTCVCGSAWIQTIWKRCSLTSQGSTIHPVASRPLGSLEARA